MPNRIKKGSSYKSLAILTVTTAAVYFALAWLGLQLASINHSVSPVWPVTGFAMAIVYTFGSRALLGVAIGAFLVNLMTPASWISALFIMCGNSLEAYVGALVFRGIFTKKDYLDFHTQTVAVFVSSALGALCSASVGVFALGLIENVPVENLKYIFLTWGIGDFLGGITLFPFFVYLFQRSTWKEANFNLRSLIKWILVFALSSFLISFVFIGNQKSAFLFLLFPILLIATYLLGQMGIWMAATLLSTCCILLTVWGWGPFVNGSLNENLIHLQLFLVAISLTSLTLSGINRNGFIKLPSVVFLVCWLLSGALFYSFETNERFSDEVKLDEITAEIQSRILSRLDTYEEVLRSGVGLYAASQKVDADEWRIFVETQNVVERYPGINGVGVIWPVEYQKLNKFAEERKKEGYPDFSIKPVPNHSLESALDRDGLNYIIKYIEPFQGNKEALGLDVSSESNRLRAANLARDTGLPAITSKIVLVQDQKKGLGFLFYLPMYKKGFSLKTVEERRKAFKGWIYAPFINEKLFAGVLGRSEKEVEFFLFEGKEASQNELVYQSHQTESFPEKFEKVTHVRIGQKDYTFGWRRGEGFVSSHDTTIAWVGLFGSLVSIFLVSLVVILQLIGEKANEIAHKLSRDKALALKKLQVVIESNPIGILSLDQNKRLITWNKACEKIFGWKKEEVLNKNIPFESLESATHFMDQILDLQKMADSFSFESTVIRRDGCQISIECAVSSIEDSQAGSLGMVVAISDVTDRLHLEKEILDINYALKEANNQQRLITNNIPVLIAYWDKNEVCRFANIPYQKWMGYTDEEVLGKNLKDVLKSEMYQKQKKFIKAAVRGEPQYFETQLVHSELGELRYVQVHYIPYIFEEQNDGFIVLAVDVSAQKEAELYALEEQRKAIAASKVKSEFLANMSHEIRTPINGILGMSDLLLATDLDLQQEDYVKIVGTSADTLLALVNDILDFSKIEAGKMELEKIQFNLSEVIQDTYQSMSFLAQEKKLHFHLNSNLSEEAFYEGDPVRIKQILINLINNAIKFTTKGEVRLQVHEMGHHGRQSRIRFEVSDTGVGIPQEALSRMFQSFSQVDASTTRKFGGTGLGLSICKQLAEMMGGSIGVESTEGKGSLFWVEINIGLKDAIEQKKSLTEEKDFDLDCSEKSILLVEDNAINQKIAVAQLEKNLFQVQVANNGLEALELLKSQRFDLILMDCQMPELDGYETTGRIRQSSDQWFCKIPIVAMTANALKGDREKCLQAGMDDYISKPVKEENLIKIIKKWLGKNPNQNEDLFQPGDSIQAEKKILNLETLQSLEELAGHGDPEFFNNILSNYLLEADSFLNRLEAGFEEKDRKQILRVAHEFKSSSAYLGLESLSQKAHELEQMSKEASFEDLGRKWQDFLETHQKSVASLMAHYEQIKNKRA